mmetsp:Transcript_45423/g.74026  ORF Transcript_45423/g.74026 Transcript_45423/m.74026 type:complete len:422 (+) Transcript_45423:20-1285(+)
MPGQPPHSSLCEHMLRLFHEQDSTDVTLYVGREKKQFRAHRIILRTRCPFFNNLLKPDYGVESRSGVIHLPEDPPTAFELFLKFLYTDILYWERDLTPEIVPDLFLLADKYQLENLMHAIEQGLDPWLSAENVLAIFSSVPPDSPIGTACVKYIARNRAAFVTVCKTGLVSVDVEMLQDLIVASKDHLNELDKFRIMKAWIDKHGMPSEQFVLDSLVDLSKITVSDIRKYIRPSKLFTSEALLNVYEARISELDISPDDVFRWELPIVELFLLSESRTVAYANENITFRTLLGATSFMYGKHSWTVRVNDICDDYSVGVAAPTANRTAWTTRQEAWVYSSTGLAFAAMRSKPYGPTFHKGAEIRVKLNMDERTVAFALREIASHPFVDLGVAFSHLPPILNPCVAIVNPGVAELLDYTRDG